MGGTMTTFEQISLGMLAAWTPCLMVSAYIFWHSLASNK